MVHLSILGFFVKKNTKIRIGISLIISHTFLDYYPVSFLPLRGLSSMSYKSRHVYFNNDYGKIILLVNWPTKIVRSVTS